MLFRSQYLDPLVIECLVVEVLTMSAELAGKAGHMCEAIPCNFLKSVLHKIAEGMTVVAERPMKR